MLDYGTGSFIIISILILMDILLLHQTLNKLKKDPDAISILILMDILLLQMKKMIMKVLDGIFQSLF